jgi:electron transport complex protein RnfC
VSLLARAQSFAHGIHPAENKESTEHLRIERMPFVSRYVLPLGQHTGAPSRPIVHPGERVERGQMIAEADGFISTSLHSPVTGTIIAIGPRRHPNGDLVPSIEIEADPYATQQFRPRPAVDWRALPPKEFVAHVQRAGLVGMGGAAFPSHVKLSVPQGKRVRRLVINGSECEPYLTCDHRLMVERPDAILRGVAIAAAKIGVEGVTIGVERNKPDAVVSLRKALAEAAPSTNGLPIDVVSLPVKYPQGAEKMLIKALFGVEVPAGKLPLDVEMVVNNVGTMAALADYFETGQPLIERVITVSGPGVAEPANLIVPLGTPVREVLERCGGLTADTREVVLGGPMMGMPVASLDVPVLKGTSGILAFPDSSTEHLAEYTCLRCGRCLEACPHFLNPSRLARLARAGRYTEMEAYLVFDCMECGCCTFACPSNIPLVQLIRVGKAAIRKKKAGVK